MLIIRSYRAEEMPWILQRAMETAWAQLVGRDLPHASSEAVAGQVQLMYQMALQTPHATILVADWPQGMEEAGPAAYALLMPQPNAFTGAREVIVLDIFTDPRLRGRRVGRSLLYHAEQYARSVGCQSLVAQVALHNRSSLQMLTGAGFQAERVVVGKRC